MATTSQTSSLTETIRSNLNNPVSSSEFDLYTGLDKVLSDVGLSVADSGGKIRFYGKDPIVPSPFRFGSMAAIAIAAKAEAAAAIAKNAAQAVLKEWFMSTRFIRTKQIPLTAHC